MSIESELVSRLEDDAGVGAVAGDRIYPTKLPQDPTYPALTYFKVSGPREYDLSGPTGWARARYQIDCWGDDYGDAHSLAAAVRASLSGFNGTLTTLHATIKLDNERDDYDEDARKNRVIQDYTVLHKE